MNEAKVPMSIAPLVSFVETPLLLVIAVNMASPMEHNVTDSFQASIHGPHLHQSIRGIDMP